MKVIWTEFVVSCKLKESPPSLLAKTDIFGVMMWFQSGLNSKTTTLNGENGQKASLCDFNLEKVTQNEQAPSR